MRITQSITTTRIAIATIFSLLGSIGTRANIAMEEISRKYPCMFPVSYEQNLKSLEKSPKIDTLIKKLNGIKSELYPKTGSLRERLVAAGRATFDEVKPVLKGLKKQLLKIHVAI